MEEFVPHCYLANQVEETAVDPYEYAFGFGRRQVVISDATLGAPYFVFIHDGIRPGRYLSDNVIFVLFSNIAATVEGERQVLTYSVGLPRYVDWRPFLK
jgi:hypothetical protein